MYVYAIDKCNSYTHSKVRKILTTHCLDSHDDGDTLPHVAQPLRILVFSTGGIIELWMLTHQLNEFFGSFHGNFAAWHRSLSKLAPEFQENPDR